MQPVCKMMSSEHHSRSSKTLFRSPSITRAAFGMTLSSLLAIGVLMRMELPQMTWPGYNIHHHESTVHIVSAPRFGPRPLQALELEEIKYSDYESTCLSRVQQNWFRRNEQQHPMSQSLEQALANYTHTVHSRCSPAAFFENYDDVMKSSSNKGCQFLLYYEGYEGVGNRLLSLVSAFAYALVTRRALIVDPRKGHLSQLLCEPFQNSSWLIPPHVGDRVVQEAVTLEEAGNQRFVNISSVRINMRHEQTKGDEKFFCTESQQGLQNVTWLVWESNQYYVPRLFMLPDFWLVLRPLFPDVSLVFTQLSRFLCLPQNAVWDKIRHVESHLASSSVQVGVQVRRHSVPDNASFSAPVHKLIMNCLLEHQILPKLPALPRSILMSFGSQLKPKPKPKVAVLVTSLRSYYYEKMKEIYTGKSTEDGSEVTFHMLSKEGMEQYSYDQAEKAFVEMWLLSFSDKLATSSWSTFGYVAQALGGLHPYILNIRGMSPEPNRPPCTIAQSREPCLQYPHVNPSLCTSCQLTPDHKDWITRHIRPCQDEARGLQLCSSSLV